MFGCIFEYAMMPPALCGTKYNNEIKYNVEIENVITAYTTLDEYGFECDSVVDIISWSKIQLYAQNILLSG